MWKGFIFGLRLLLFVDRWGKGGVKGLSFFLGKEILFCVFMLFFIEFRLFFLFNFIFFSFLFSVKEFFVLLMMLRFFLLGVIWRDDDEEFILVGKF